jgi:hypothetical protein
MGEQLDRRGFLRFGRKSAEEEASAAAEAEAEREPTPQELKYQELAEFSERYLADFATEDEEPVADGPLLTKAYDQAYMRVTTGHVVYTTVLGVSAAVPTATAVSFDTDPPVELEGYGKQVIGVLRAHHPADPPHITRSYAFRFPEGTPLIPAIRTACNMPEPEPEAEEEDDEYADDLATGAAEGQGQEV